MLGKSSRRGSAAGEVSEECEQQFGVYLSPGTACQSEHNKVDTLDESTPRAINKETNKQESLRPHRMSFTIQATMHTADLDLETLILLKLCFVYM